MIVGITVNDAPAKMGELRADSSLVPVKVVVQYGLSLRIGDI